MTYRLIPGPGTQPRGAFESNVTLYETAVTLLLTSINWFGLASIQFFQPESGAPVLIDFNGRRYGSLVFANACGMRAMENWARLAAGSDPAPTQEKGS